MKWLRRSVLDSRMALQALGPAWRSMLTAAILASSAFPAQAPVASAQPVSLDIALAIQMVATHARDSGYSPPEYGQAQALLFKNNPQIQQLALNGYIKNDTYQALQRDYAALNEGFASDAAGKVGADFTKQVSKTPSCYSPGTDSDYIVKVTDPAQVSQMQSNYNQAVSQYLDSNGVLGPEDVSTEWHRRLDTDFMAEPSLVTNEQFSQIKALNNAAYGRRDSADMEKLLRQPIQSTELTPESFNNSVLGIKTDTKLLAEKVDALTADGTITPDRVSAYAQEMQDMQAHRAELVDAVQRAGNFAGDDAANAELFKNMALQQKYISRVETLTDALRLQNGLDPVDRGGASLALRGSDRAAENFAVANSAGSVADNSLSRANMELASSIAEVAKTNPDFAASGPSTIASMSQGMSPADKGFLLDQLRASNGDDYAKATAAAMRGTTDTSPTYKASARAAADSASQQAAQEAGASAPDSTFSTWDKVMADSLGIDNDLSKLSVNRQQLNQLGQKWLPQISNVLGPIFIAKEAVGAGMDMQNYLSNVSKAMDSNTPDAVAQQYLQNAQQIAEGMIAKGTFGAGLTALMEAFPTAGAIVGSFAISYNGSRWVLEKTGGDQAVTIDLAVGAIDAGQQALEGAGNSADRFWNGSDRAQREANALLNAYQGALDRGEIVLRDGVTQQDLVEAVNAGDIRRIRTVLIENNQCGLARSQVNLVSKAPATATATPTTPAPKPGETKPAQGVPQICNWGGSWKGSGSYPSTLTVTLTQTVKTDKAGHVTSIMVAPAPSDVSNPDAPIGDVFGNVLTLNGSWSIGSGRGGTVEYVMDPGCNQFSGSRYDCYKGTPLPGFPAPACSSGSFTPLKVSYQRTSGPPMVPAGG
jgi:hypothetical protein